MSVMKLPLTRRIVTNYIGGVGYYLFHAAWAVATFMSLVRIMQFVILSGDTVLHAPAQSTVAAPADDVSTPAVVAFAVSGIAIVLVITFVVLLPYWLGYVSRNIPRWVLGQTSWKVTVRSLHVAKQSLIAVVFTASIFGLFQPAMEVSANLAFLVVAGACVFASIAFALQYILITLWKIPERYVY